MATIILLNQSAASQRVVPLPPLVQSNGTSACTNESGATFFFSVGGVYYGSGGSISAISAPMGLYECLFSASKVSVVGQGRVMYSSGTALPASTPIDIVKYDSYDSTRLGLIAIPNSAPNVSGGLPQLGTDYGSLFTVGVSNIKGATYSSVTFDGLNRINSSVTIANATYSAVSLRLDSVDYSSAVTVGVGKIKAAAYSGVSVEVTTGGIQTASFGAGSYSGVTFDGARFLSVAGERSAASSLLSTNIGNSRFIQEAFFALRNRIQISGSTGTVFLTDDATSSWTFSVTTAVSAIQGIDPGGA